MSKFKVGDRVRVYTSFSPPHLCGVITEIGPDREIAVIFDGEDFETHGYHRNQCRRLKPKAKPMEFWIVESAGGSTYVYREHAPACLGQDSIPGSTLKLFREVK